MPGARKREDSPPWNCEVRMSPITSQFPSPLAPAYPDGSPDRDRWIESLRPSRGSLPVPRPAGWFVEFEPDAVGARVPVLTVFLTNRECPWRCVFCDLWKAALTEAVGPGDIAAQIDRALADPVNDRLSPAHLKLYNAGSFFDPAAIPLVDYPAIARRACRFREVTVESHPSLIGARCWRFRDLLEEIADRQPPRLEVAMGLETAHAEVLERLNKRLTLETFVRATEALGAEGIAVRAFCLLQPPFERPEASVEWAVRSAEFAFDHKVGVVVLIPVRAGNGALEVLRDQGWFRPPTLQDLENALEGALRLRKGRVFADLWDLETFSSCVHCYAARLRRLEAMNFSQTVIAPVACPHCGAGS